MNNGKSLSLATEEARQIPRISQRIWGKGAADALGRRVRVISLTDNVAWITAVGNDYAYQDIFVRQLEQYGQPGDLVFAMSVSGSSPNLVKAIEWANANGLRSVALVGGKKGRLADIAHEVLAIESTHYGRVEDAHMTICHMLCYALMECNVGSPTA